MVALVNDIVVDLLVIVEGFEDLTWSKLVVDIDERICLTV